MVVPSTNDNVKDLVGSGFCSAEVMSAAEARRRLALPRTNDAEELVMIRIPAGKEIIIAKGNDMSKDPDFWPDAFGGAEQIYIPDHSGVEAMKLGGD